MKNILVITVACVLATAAAAAQDMSSGASGMSPLATTGKVLMSSNGGRLGSVYRVDADGSAKMIIDGKMVTVPASTLSNVDGRLTTSLSKSEVIALR